MKMEAEAATQGYESAVEVNETKYANGDSTEDLSHIGKK